MNWRLRISECSARVFGLDVRSLAVFRVAVGGLLLADLWVRVSDLAAMYSDAGIAPVTLVRGLRGKGQWSLHLLSGAVAYQAGLFLLAAALAAALIVGYRTRLATIGSWILLASLHVRLPVVLNAGDTLLRVLLFWSMFLPLGEAWSIDARRRPSPAGRLVATPATVAFVLQLAVVYWFAGLAKWNDAWLHGDALAQIFSFQFYGQPLGRYLLDFPGFTRWLSRGVVGLELVGPLLLFVPCAMARIRTALVVVFIAFHLGIAATITVGLFPWVGIAAWLALVPPQTWNRLSRAPAPTPKFTDNKLAAVGFAAAMAMVLCWNVITLGNARAASWVSRLANVTMLRQSWDVFATPARFDAQFVYQGRLKDGRLVDLVTNAPLTGGADDGLKPRQLPNHRWRKLHLWITRPAFAAYRQPLADYVCRHWNEEHSGDEQAVRLDLYCLRRRLEPGRAAGDYVRNNLARVVVSDEGGNFAEALRELGP